jgi:hypothetical protein
MVHGEFLLFQRPRDNRHTAPKASSRFLFETPVVLFPPTRSQSYDTSLFYFFFDRRNIWMFWFEF